MSDWVPRRVLDAAHRAAIAEFKAMMPFDQETAHQIVFRGRAQVVHPSDLLHCSNCGFQVVYGDGSVLPELAEHLIEGHGIKVSAA